MKKENLEGRINLHIDLFKEVMDKEGDSIPFPEEGLNLNGSQYNLKIFELDKPEHYYISLEDREKDLDVISSLATPRDPWIVLDKDDISIELISHMNTDYLLKVKARDCDLLFFGYPADSGFIETRYNGLAGYIPIISLNCCLSFVEKDNNLILNNIYRSGDLALCGFCDVEYIRKASSKEIWLYNEIQKRIERGN